MGSLEPDASVVSSGSGARYAFKHTRQATQAFSRGQDPAWLVAPEPPAEISDEHHMVDGLSVSAVRKREHVANEGIEQSACRTLPCPGIAAEFVPASGFRPKIVRISDGRFPDGRSA